MVGIGVPCLPLQPHLPNYHAGVSDQFVVYHAVDFDCTGVVIDRPGDLLDFLFRCFGPAYFAAGLFYKKRGTARWSLLKGCY